MKLYYTPPSDEQFNELKEKAIMLWKIVDRDNDKYGYATEKISRIKDIPNVSDNFMYMVAMFDSVNQTALGMSLSLETKMALRERLISGGMPEEYINF